MKIKDLFFDDSNRMFISIEGQQEKLTIVLSDDLEVIDEALTESYKQTIVNFINNSNEWCPIFKEYISEWGKDEYNTDTDKGTYVLINIFILFEQSESEVYGIEFGVDFDEEHNCGIKVKATENGFEVFEIGTGDIAFS